METHPPINGPITRDSSRQVKAGPPHLSVASEGDRLLQTGAALTAVIAALAYLSGWLAHNELTPARLTDAFEQVDGVYPGFSRNHANRTSDHLPNVLIFPNLLIHGNMIGEFDPESHRAPTRVIPEALKAGLPEADATGTWKLLNAPSRAETFDARCSPNGSPENLPAKGTLR
jgi:hypothetical protein